MKNLHISMVLLLTTASHTAFASQPAIDTTMTKVGSFLSPKCAPKKVSFTDQLTIRHAAQSPLFKSPATVSGMTSPDNIIYKTAPKGIAAAATIIFESEESGKFDRHLVRLKGKAIDLFKERQRSRSF